MTFAAPTASQTNTAPETGGSLSRVDFSSGASLLGAATAAPYTYTWSNVPAGSYTFTAVATDTNNVSTPSSPVSVSVGAAAVTQVYYIYTDQLNTPRLITDTANTVVWRNDQADPFNASAPYDDPGNTGHHFVFNLRFPGQYYDQETGLAYNYFRDYDANTGRYVQSDPVGLDGGINTYAYVGGNPLSYIDPLGLWSVTFGVFNRVGGEVSFGRDPVSGGGFMTGRVGFGYGGGLKWEKNGGRPGGDDKKSCDSGGVGLGTYLDIGFNAGPLQAGLGAHRGRNWNGNGMTDDYNSGIQPNWSIGDSTGIRLGGSVGAEFTIFDRRR